MRPFSLILPLFFLASSSQAAYSKQAEEFYGRGVQLKKQGKYDAALASFSMALAEDPGLAACYREMGTCLYLSGDIGYETQLYYHKYLKLRPGDSATAAFAQAVTRKYKAWLVQRAKAAVSANGDMMVPAGMEIPRHGKDKTYELAGMLKLAEAKRLAKESGKPLLCFVILGCHNPHSGVRWSYGGSVQDASLSRIHELFSHPHYGPWIKSRFVVTRTESDSECWYFFDGLVRAGGQVPVEFSPKSLISKADGGDWDSLSHDSGPENFVRYLAECLIRFQTPGAAPKRQAVFPMVPAEGTFKIGSSTGVRPIMRNLYISTQASGPFTKLNTKPFDDVDFVIRRLSPDKSYYVKEELVLPDGSIGSSWVILRGTSMDARLREP